MSHFSVGYMSLQDCRSSQPADVKFRWLALLALAAAAFATVTAELLPAGLLFQLSSGLGVSQSAVGLLVAVWALTIAATSIPLVRITRRVSRGVLLSLALVVFALATAGTALAPSYQVALVGRFLSACAHGLFWSLLIPTAASLAPRARVGRAVSVVLAGPALAGIVGVPVGAAIGAAVGWRAAFLLVAATLGLASVAVHLLALPDPPVVRGQRPSQSVASTTGAVTAVAAAAALVLTGHFLLYTYISPLLQEFGGYRGDSRPVLLFVFGLGGLIGIAVSGPLSDRFPRSGMTWVSTAFAVSALSLRLLALNEICALILLAIWGVLIGLLPPVFQVKLQRTAAPGTEATAGAIGITVVNLGIAAGAVLGGISIRMFPIGALPLIASVIIAISAAAQAISDIGFRRRTLASG